MATSTQKPWEIARAAAQTVAARQPYSDIITRAATATGIPAQVLAAVIKQESGFNPRARSSAGAGGLMQLMPATARELGVTNIYDPEQNVHAGARYLKKQLDRFGALPTALAAYNAGPGAVQRYGGQVPPYRETRAYVTAIMRDLGKPLKSQVRQNMQPAWIRSEDQQNETPANLLAATRSIPPMEEPTRPSARPRVLDNVELLMRFLESGGAKTAMAGSPIIKKMTRRD
jgi:soluble lytic murein transglycosylase-like protein